LLALCRLDRDESGRTDPVKAKANAQALHKAGAQLTATELKAAFNQCALAAQGLPQLRLTFEEYKKLANRDFEELLRKLFKGDELEAFLAIVKVAKDTPAFFAEKLHGSMAGLGTRDHSLIRLVVSRSEIDLLTIMQTYHRLYHISLETDIKGDTSGKYKDALLALCRAQML